MAEGLSKQPRPRGPRLTIVTNAGGPGVLATDALIPNGGELTPLSQESLSALNGFLPSHWSHANPIDILGDADPELYERAVKIAMADPLSDGFPWSSLPRNDESRRGGTAAGSLRERTRQACTRELDGRTNGRGG